MGGIRGFQRSEPSLNGLWSEVWRFRWPVWTVFKRDLTAPFKGTFFGKFWSIVLPLVPVGAYLFLRLVLAPGRTSDGMHAAVYVVVGVTVWYLLSDVLLATMNSAKRRRAVLSETSFPLLGAVISSYGTIIFEVVVRLLVLLPVVIALEGLPGWGALWIFPLLLMAICFFGGLGIFLLCITFVFPDIEQIVSVVMRYLIFLSLVIFPLPDVGMVSQLIPFNPFAFFVDLIREVVVFGRLEVSSFLWGYAAISVVGFFGAMKLLAVLRVPIRSLVA